jgi:lipopolysaccharide heptosyltransferase II
MKRTQYKIINKKKKFLVNNADRLLSIAEMLRFIPHSLNPPDIMSVTVKKILIIRLAYIGDVVMTLPVLKPLSNAFPNADIDFLTSRHAASLLEHNPHLHSVIPFNAPWFYKAHEADRTADLVTSLGRSRYDLGIDFRGDIRNIYNCLYRPGIRYRLSYNSGGGGKLLTHSVDWVKLKHKVEYHLDLLRRLGLQAEATCPEIFLTDEEVKTAETYLSRLPGCRSKSPVVIHPGARLSLKKWPVRRFVELAKKIDKHALGPIVIVDTEGSMYGREISENAPVSADLSGALSVREMAGFLSVCRVVICHDSGPMHIAAAVKTPVIALFGPSRPVETSPCGDQHTVVEAPCDEKDNCDEKNCLIGNEGCMHRITVESVFREIQKYS